MTLPPEVPLTPEEELDELLQPLPEDPPELYDEDGWEAITNAGDVFSSASLYDVVGWIREINHPIRTVQLIRHEEGDLR